MSTYLRRMLMPLIVLLACSSVRAQTPAAATQTPSVQKMLTVGVKVAPPFVIEDHGHYSGLAINL